jgi:hypothetical protein
MHLQFIKRAGRGHAPGEDSVTGTKAGECALLCPACPQPGKNLPLYWEKVPFHKVCVKTLVPFVHLAEYCTSFLYALYITLDANF